jgi:hypothetical protein
MGDGGGLNCLHVEMLVAWIRDSIDEATADNNKAIWDRQHTQEWNEGFIDGLRQTARLIEQYLESP